MAEPAVALTLDTEVDIVAFEDARDASPQLLALLQNADAQTRARAALAVGRIGRAEDVARLAALLEDTDVEVRRTAAFALGEVEDSTAGFPLEELLLSGFEKDPEVRELAVHGLGKLGRGAEACRAALHDGEESVQARALLSAWRIPGATEIEEMLQFSRHKKTEVRWCAAYCLMRMAGAPPSGRTPVPEGTALTDEDQDRIAARLLVLTSEPDPRIVLQAARGLRTRRDDAVTTRMVELLSHDDWRVRVEAIRTLAATLPQPEPGQEAESSEASSATGSGSDAASGSGSGDGTSAQSESSEGEDAQRGEVTASRPLTPLPDRREVSVASLEPLLDDPNPNVVATVIEALARIGGEEGAGLLYAQFTSPVARHRELALTSLATRLREQKEAIPDETGFAATEAEVEAGDEVRALAQVESKAHLNSELVGDSSSPAEDDAVPESVQRFVESRDRFFDAITPFLTDPVWSVSAACAEVGDLLPAREQGDFYLALAQQEGRIAKVAVGPYLAWRDARTQGWPSLDEFQPQLAEFLLAPDPMVVLMTLTELGEAWERAAADTLAETLTDTLGDEHDGPGPGDAEHGDGWALLAHLLEEQRARGLSDPQWSDVRQTIVGIAAPHADVPEMKAILDRSAEDPNYVVRRDAIQALEAADEVAPRAAGPVETEHTRAELREILEWARRDHRAVFETAAGTFEARLFTGDAPLTCWNFAQLAEAGFYDDGAWHRVVPDFVLQDGCPRGDGWGGPAHQIRCEVNRHRYGRGALGMALSGKDTGGSQFFFTHSEQPHLDGGYTVFGELVKGRPVADLVSQGEPIRRIRVVED